MKRLTYKQAYNKIIEAYFRDEIKPYDACFCFCGTLADNNSEWCLDSFHGNHADFMHYSGKEYGAMERPLLNAICGVSKQDKVRYEEALFEGMSNSLDVLKEIHRERGEDVDEVQFFTKRTLQPA